MDMRCGDWCRDTVTASRGAHGSRGESGDATEKDLGCTRMRFRISPSFLALLTYCTPYLTY